MSATLDAEQERAIAPAPPGERKVALATAIAETSLASEGVRVVVAGLREHGLEALGWTKESEQLRRRLRFLRRLEPEEWPDVSTEALLLGLDWKGRDKLDRWAPTYFEVRKDLRGRYPKHHWPDDPLTATPTKRTRGRG